MKCFYHNDKDAVGICKSCEKGLCIDCAVDLGKGLACKNHCEEDVKRLIDISVENIQDASNTSEILRSRKTAGPVVLKIFSPVVFFLFIMTLVFWDASTLMGLVMGCLLIFLIIQYSIIIIKMPLPFTLARVMVQSGAFPKMILFQMIFIGIAIGLIYLVMRLNIWISVIMCPAFFFMIVNANRKIRKKGFILE
jgi:hypothetical protein